jgi:hypothetical protein
MQTSHDDDDDDTNATLLEIIIPTLHCPNTVTYVATSIRSPPRNSLL